MSTLAGPDARAQVQFWVCVSANHSSRVRRWDGHAVECSVDFCVGPARCPHCECHCRPLALEQARDVLAAMLHWRLRALVTMLHSRRGHSDGVTQLHHAD